MSERYSRGDCAMRELEAAQAETERGAAFEALVASAKANEKLAAAVLNGRSRPGGERNLLALPTLLVDMYLPLSNHDI